MSEKKAWALCLHAKDNVATVLKDVQAGESITVRDKSGQTLGAFAVSWREGLIWFYLQRAGAPLWGSQSLPC